jgi:hypothetical protein
MPWFSSTTPAGAAELWLRRFQGRRRHRSDDAREHENQQRPGGHTVHRKVKLRTTVKLPIRIPIRINENRWPWARSASESPRRSKMQNPSRPAGRPFLGSERQKSGPISGATGRKRQWKDVRKGDARGYPAKPGKLSADVGNICEGHSFLAASFLSGTRCISPAKTKGKNEKPWEAL